VCGIAGIISPKGGIRPDTLRKMSAALQHRGPDGFGYLLYSASVGTRIWHNEEIDKFEEGREILGFAHRRLSIIDLSADSLQPMSDETGSISVVFNGEIYNYVELREELQQLGCTFRTTGDTEVLLKAYLAWGSQCVKRFNGMWAFVLFDAPNKRIIFSRDRFGIKPLYYTVQNESIYFASEIKGLLAINSISRSPNESAVSYFLMTGVIDNTQETFFEGILNFPAAQLAEVSLSEPSLKIRVNPYWSFPTSRFYGTEHEAVEQFRFLFLDAVRVHSRSDVPIGTCLSGGLDSSSVVCSSEILRRKGQIPKYSHSAFGYCSSDEEFSERHFMQMVVDATGIRMNYVETTYEDFVASLPQILQAQDEPFGSASIAVQWFVFRSARNEGMTVMLDGQGADEMLGGYHYYYKTLANQFLSKFQLIRFHRLRAEHQREIGAFPIPLKTVIFMLMPPIAGRVLYWALPVLRSRNRRPVNRNRASIVLSSTLRERYLAALPNKKRVAGSLNEVLREDVKSLSLPGLLRYEDRNSMAQSIEARVPFLDHRVVEFVFTLPDDWKIRGLTTKYILRQAMRGVLPEDIRSRKDKIGFKATPSLTFDFARQYKTALVDNKTEFERRWFKPEGVESMINSVDRSVKGEFMLWRIINTKLWARQFWGDAEKLFEK
jgi:asparagine synthase (glutamine-hydrolysing)